MRIPLPPPAAAIWQRWGGQLPMPTQQERNRRLKLLGQAAGLTRDFVANSFSGKVRNEQVLPVWQAITTHTARHIGAARLILGSEGDQTLKEIALGHVSASVYGYDTLERYGPCCYRRGRQRSATERPQTDRGQKVKLPPVFSVIRCRNLPPLKRKKPPDSVKSDF